MKIPAKHQLILSELYDSDAWRIFRKLILETKQLESAQNGVFSQDMQQLSKHQGRIEVIKEIESEMRANFKRQNREDVVD